MQRNLFQSRAEIALQPPPPTHTPRASEPQWEGVLGTLLTGIILAPGSYVSSLPFLPGPSQMTVLAQAKNEVILIEPTNEG